MSYFYHNKVIRIKGVVVIAAHVYARVTRAAKSKVLQCLFLEDIWRFFNGDAYEKAT